MITVSVMTATEWINCDLPEVMISSFRHYQEIYVCQPRESFNRANGKHNTT